MTPFMSLLLPIVVSAVAVFVLTLIIHMTPLHNSDYIKLPDEDGVLKALRPFNIPPNDYMVPRPGSGADMGPRPSRPPWTLCCTPWPPGGSSR